MSDTLPCINWALGQQCRLRQGPDWELPATAIKTLADCRTYSDLSKKRDRGWGVFGDVCVTSVTRPLIGTKTYDYPGDGFCLSSQFSSLGGVAALHRLCGDCPANGDSAGLAGCFGSFYLSPYSKELQEHLQWLIDRLGLAAKLNAVFPETRRHWFRFWMSSPLQREQVSLLVQLLNPLYEENGPVGSGGADNHADLKAFIAGLERSLRANIPMHVNLAPPGHADMGWYTIFPHCPRCKAGAPLPPWQRKYKDEEMVCEICGGTFSPAKTHSSIAEKWERTELYEALSPAQFERVVLQSLMAQGATEAEAAVFFREQEKQNSVRRENQARLVAEAERHRQYVEKVIYAGLRNIASPGDGADWLFSAEDLEEILRRGEERKAKVFCVSHLSESGEQDEYVEVKFPLSARQTLWVLRQKGCNEKFYTRMKIPQEIVDRWVKE